MSGIELVIGIVFLIFGAIYTWWDHHNPDKEFISTGTIDVDTVEKNNDRKAKQRAALRAKMEKLERDNPGKEYYRVGATIYEKPPERMAAEKKVRELNAQYNDGHKRWYTDEDDPGKVLKKGVYWLHQWELQAKMRLYNLALPPNSQVCFDDQSHTLMWRGSQEYIDLTEEEQSREAAKCKDLGAVAEKLVYKDGNLTDTATGHNVFVTALPDDGPTGANDLLTEEHETKLTQQNLFDED